MRTVFLYALLMVISAVSPSLIAVVCSEPTVQFAGLISNWSSLIWTVLMFTCPLPMFWTYILVEDCWKATLCICTAFPVLFWIVNQMYVTPAMVRRIVISRIAVAIGCIPVLSGLILVLCFILCVSP